ncbi:MAG: hypothetical protein FJY75_02865 [Candidatus Eisenbacteria bacterium]|uniref:Uncharacterized protein n=1 Tax=Eiseniibacteriota bacterium TaxID=2212470 RepID=A0A938BQ50_UNCEI|nr:hypothetical protein [Candidatus Eisenbacteria bacterium]
MRDAPAGARLLSPRLASLLLVALLILFCAGTRWGRTYPRFAGRSWHALDSGLRVSAEARRRGVLDQTYPFLLYLREMTPPGAVILLPPREFIIAGTGGGFIPLLASPSSAYSFIYPRIPVHFGDRSPHGERIDYILVWDHWGLEWVDPEAPRDEVHRYRLYRWPQGEGAPR